MRIEKDIAAGHNIDWGRTAQDYAQHRPGPPESYYSKLRDLGLGVSGQRLLDLGTGTGVLSRKFAEQGCDVSASDIAEGQVQMARRLAKSQGLNVNFYTAPAKDIPFADNTFDVITACQCWWYFDHRVLLPEIRRVLKADGRLVISSFSFLPREDPIVAASEKLVLEYNPDWGGAGWDGSVPVFGDSMPPETMMDTMFVYDEDIPFTRESWRGRMRALRGIGASLPQAEIDAFDASHDIMLRDIAGDAFTIRHRIDAHIYKFEKETA